MAATPRTQSPSSPCEPHRTASLDLFSLSSATDRACSQTIRSPQRQHHRTASDSQHSFQPPWPKPSPTSTGHRDKSSIGSNYFKLMVEPSASSATAAATPFIDIDMSATTLARTAKASGNTTTAASGAESGSPVSAMQHRRPKWPPSTSHRRSSAATTPEHSTLDGHNILPAPMQQMDSPNSTQNGQAPLAEQEAAHNDEDGEYDSTSSIRHHTIDHNINDVAGSSDASPSSAGSIAEALSNSSSSAIESCKKPGSPKRMLPHDSTSETPSRSRRRSPGESHRPGHSLSTRKRSAESLRLVLPPGTSSQNVMPVTTLRAETLPEKLSVAEDGDAIVMVTPQHLVNLIDSAGEDILLLDVRISRQYALSTISGALNLCIPTTLLKRPSFNTQKVADSFKDSKQKAKFERWKSNSHIVVFDAHSSRLEEASICTSTLNKFRNQDWSGCLYVIRGGFDQFAHTFPTYITTDQHMAPAVTPSSLKLTTNVESKAPPVLGGCPMPANKNAANPFFGNIRQNMDLIGGVGQIPIRLPASISDGTAARLPTWLRSVLAGDDAGKIVAENFLQIERTEQKRMQHALSGEVCIGSPLPVSADRPQIAGIEKGGKNRYNNIWPYEHSRVKLEEVPNGGCDYVNANFVQASWSPKRYIATQGPVPSTFADFWSVVWHQEISVVVMLTAEKEGGLVKADNYWEKGRYGPFQLSLLSESRAPLDPSAIRRNAANQSTGGVLRGNKISKTKLSRPKFDRKKSSTTGFLLRKQSAADDDEEPYLSVRKFSIIHTDKPFERIREVTQLHYSHWPDFGAPALASHVLGLVQQCNAVVEATKQQWPQSSQDVAHPILVHCSAGCGRTGTFCTIDTVIDTLKRQRAARSSGRKISSVSSSQLTPRGAHLGNGSVMGEAPGSVAGGRPSAAALPAEDVDLVERVVEDFRLQRISLVQSLRQYVLCYETVLEWIANEEVDVEHPSTPSPSPGQ